MNGMEIDRNRKKPWNNQSYEELYNVFNEITYSLHNAGFIDFNNAKSLMTDDGYFNFCVPLNILLGFCEDYKYDN